jgi:hypothetical protein
MENLKIAPLSSQSTLAREHQLHDAGMLHPAVLIYIWICLSLAAQILGSTMLMPLVGMLILLALRISGARFVLLLRRTRWVLFSLFLIYAYATPGAELWPDLGMASPVTEGVVDGIVQLLRLLVVLSGLSILLSLVSQLKIIAGLYALARPLGFLGISRERVAVRLALTLSYAESAMQNSAGNWRGIIEQLFVPLEISPGYIELQLSPFSVRDGLMVVAVSAALLGAWL